MRAIVDSPAELRGIIRWMLARGAAVNSYSGAATQTGCDFCAADLPSDHRHLFDSKRASVLCACRICSLLFRQGIATTNRYRVVPKTRARIEGFTFDALVWRSLDIPAQAAYFLYSSAAGKTVAYYPSRSGSMESLLTMNARSHIERANPVLLRLVPDVQALLVNGVGAAAEGWIVGIDVCYRFVASLQSSWLQHDPKHAMQQSQKQFFETVRDCVPCT